MWRNRISIDLMVLKAVRPTIKVVRNERRQSDRANIILRELEIEYGRIEFRLRLRPRFIFYFIDSLRNRDNGAYFEWGITLINDSMELLTLLRLENDLMSYEEYKYIPEGILQDCQELLEDTMIRLIHLQLYYLKNSQDRKISLAFFVIIITFLAYALFSWQESVAGQAPLTLLALLFYGLLLLKIQPRFRGRSH